MQIELRNCNKVKNANKQNTKKMRNNPKTQRLYNRNVIEGGGGDGKK